MIEKEMSNILYVNGIWLKNIITCHYKNSGLDNGADFRVTQGELDVVQPNTKQMTV